MTYKKKSILCAWLAVACFVLAMVSFKAIPLFASIMLGMCWRINQEKDEAEHNNN